MKIDPAMLKQINQVVTAELKKNKDIKAATDVEKNIDKYISKNRMSLDNANKLAKLEALIVRIDRTLENLSKTVDLNSRARDILDNDIMKLEQQVKLNTQDIKKLMSDMKKGR